MDFNIVQSFIIKLPSIDELKRVDRVRELVGKYSEAIVEEYLKKIIDKRHKAIVSAIDDTELSALDFSFDFYINSLKKELATEKGRPLKKVINCTGTVYSNYMGNRFYSDEILENFHTVFGTYSNIGMDEEKGELVNLDNEIKKLMGQFLKNRDYILVNSVGSALFLAINTFFKEKTISMGIADTYCFDNGIGVQDIIEKAGASVNYLGYINKVSKAEFENAAADNNCGVVYTDMLQNINFDIGKISFDDYKNLGAAAKNIYISDRVYVHTESDEVKMSGISLAEAADSRIWISIVDTSKLIGGPETGLIIAAPETIAFLKSNFMYKVLIPSRENKMLFYFTMKAYSEKRYNEIFINKCFSLTKDKLREKNRRFMRNLEREVGDRAEIGSYVDRLFKIEDNSKGSQTFEREIVFVKPEVKNAAEIEKNLRTGEPSVICWLDADKILFNLQMVSENDENTVVDILAKYLN